MIDLTNLEEVCKTSGSLLVHSNGTRKTVRIMVTVGDVVLERARQAIVGETFTQLDNSYKESGPRKLVCNLAQCLKLVLGRFITIRSNGINIPSPRGACRGSSQAVLGLDHGDRLGSSSHILVSLRLHDRGVQPAKLSETRYIRGVALQQLGYHILCGFTDTLHCELL